VDSPKEERLTMSGERGLDYRAAGVDLDRAERDKAGLKGLLGSTKDERTLSDLGLFGGLYALPGDVPDPVLVASADGVGTKLRVAFLSDVHHTVGQDLVNHCVNDILVQGARPLFFLDYLATGAVRDGIVQEVVRGVADGCRLNGCVLLGGETAQMSDFYAAGEYDLAGFIVGVVSRDRIIDGRGVEEGDILIALSSTGLHTNGYTLARKILLEAEGLAVSDPFPGLEVSVGEALLRVHRSYLPALRGEVERGTLRGLAHITGGGIPGNLPRSLPEGMGAEVRKAGWEVPALFRTIQAIGGVDEEEMFRVFNMGVGMIAIVAPSDAEGVIARVETSGEAAWVLGRVTGAPGVHFV
jgi:phosphoribosylformylglycinamidine cyclo-ligase